MINRYWPPLTVMNRSPRLGMHRQPFIGTHRPSWQVMGRLSWSPPKGFSLGRPCRNRTFSAPWKAGGLFLKLLYLIDDYWSCCPFNHINVFVYSLWTFPILLLTRLGSSWCLSEKVSFIIITARIECSRLLLIMILLLVIEYALSEN